MTAFASLVLTNAALATVTFNPMGKDPKGVATWMTNDSVYDSKKKVTMSTTLPGANTGVVRIKQKVMIPIMDSIDPTKKLSEAYVNIEAVLPKNASQTVRLDLRKLADTLLAHAVSTAAFGDLEGIY